MAMFSLIRSLRRRTGGATPLTVFLLVTVALAVWLGYQALDAAASHRRTAEAVLRDYAGISATELARVARGDLDDVLDDAFEPVLRRERFRGDATPAQILREMDDAARGQGCECPSLRAPLFAFRLIPGPNGPTAAGLTVAPDTLAVPTRARLVELVTAASAAAGDRERLLTVPGGELMAETVAIGWVLPDDDPEPGDDQDDDDPDDDDDQDDDEPSQAVFGFVVSSAALSELFQEWFDDQQLLPQPIAGEAPNDSLLYVTVEAPGGEQVFASPIAYPTELVASAPVSPELGDLVVHAAIRPDAASSLIIGGLPNSRLPLLVALLLLTLGVGGFTFVQLRREQGFQRLREDFVSGVSHELRTPLAQIRMFSELQEAGKLPSAEDQKRAVTVIAREARRLSHLVDNILQFSALSRTRGQGMPREPLDLSDAVREGVEAVRPLLLDRGMKLDVSAEPGLHVLGNREAIARVVVNLLDNAVKYGPRGQTVRVAIARANHVARLSVEDEGPGVPPGDRTRVFQAYTRLDRDVKARIPGSGIGLSVVSELAELHGGKASVEEGARGGARFVVELPIAPTVPSDQSSPRGSFAQADERQRAGNAATAYAERTR
jgi:signal transduction histidine kinase